MILEVGAGNGRLGYFLAQKLNSAYPCHCLLMPTTGPEPSNAASEQGKEGESREDCLRKFRIACTDSSARGLSGASFLGALMHVLLSTISCFLVHVGVAGALRAAGAHLKSYGLLGMAPAEEVGHIFPVEELTHLEALAKYSPQTVIAW
jgi:hypothetical protein